jgi:hypothetical protein
MKVKMWEMTKEDLEKLGSRIMVKTIEALVKNQYLYPDDAKDFLKSHSIFAMTPDCLDDSISKKIFPKENLNAHCLFKVIKID